MNSAIAGLRSMQAWLDVIGNNVVNTNSTAYKASRATFQDLLFQTERSASGPQGGLGGVNSQQIGLGVRVGGIQTIDSQGAIQTTGRITDFAIQGDGFFVVNDGIRDFYTRDGSFDLALNGTLISALNGYTVKAWPADITGAVDSTQPPTTVVIPIGQQGDARESSTIVMAGNLDAATADADTVVTTITVFDSLGVQHLVQLTLTKDVATPGSWTLSASSADAAITSVSIAANATVTFNSSGGMTSTNPTLDVDFDNTVTLANDLTVANGNNEVTLDMDGSVTQLSAESALASRSQDGYSSGTLASFSASNTGIITGVFTNGQQKVLGQVAMSTFPNPAGLDRVGSNLFEVSANSGDPAVGTPGSGSRGQVANGALEGSNVDLAQEFTNMILAQRSFQANGRVITTNDDVLQELVNLKR